MTIQSSIWQLVIMANLMFEPCVSCVPTNTGFISAPFAIRPCFDRSKRIPRWKCVFTAPRMGSKFESREKSARFAILSSGGNWLIEYRRCRLLYLTTAPMVLPCFVFNPAGSQSGKKKTSPFVVSPAWNYPVSGWRSAMAVRKVP